MAKYAFLDVKKPERKNIDFKEKSTQNKVDQRENELVTKFASEYLGIEEWEKKFLPSTGIEEEGDMEESLMRSEEYSTDKIQVEVDLMEESMEELGKFPMRMLEFRFTIGDQDISSFLNLDNGRDSNLY